MGLNWQNMTTRIDLVWDIIHVNAAVNWHEIGARYGVRLGSPVRRLKVEILTLSDEAVFAIPQKCTDCRHLDSEVIGHPYDRSETGYCLVRSVLVFKPRARTGIFWCQDFTRKSPVANQHRRAR